MIKLRLSLSGKKKQKSFRIIVTDSRSKRDGKFIEKVGYYCPYKQEIKLDANRVEYWKMNGVQISPTVSRIIREIHKKELN